MAEISSLGYVGLGVSSLDEWEIFATDILGMQIGGRNGDIMTLRMDEYLQRFVLIENGKDDIMFAGWEFNSASELEDYVEEIRGKGVEVRELTSEERSVRHAEKAYAVRDPSGYAHEFFFGHGVAKLEDQFRSKVLKSGFVTGVRGVGLILPLTPDTMTGTGLLFYTDSSTPATRKMLSFCLEMKRVSHLACHSWIIRWPSILPPRARSVWC
jgi:catechol 2,3-dioxygenase-like lactoylglutathione lyase family enzyme